MLLRAALIFSLLALAALPAAATEPEYGKVLLRFTEMVTSDLPVGRELRLEVTGWLDNLSGRQLRLGNPARATITAVEIEGETHKVTIRFDAVQLANGGWAPLRVSPAAGRALRFSAKRKYLVSSKSVYTLEFELPPRR